jgi:hypothetical protein
MKIKKFYKVRLLFCYQKTVANKIMILFLNQHRLEKIIACFSAFLMCFFRLALCKTYTGVLATLSVNYIKNIASEYFLMRTPFFKTIFVLNPRFIL